MKSTPVFYDVCMDTFNADTDSLKAAIKAVKEEGKLNPKAIIAVDLFGQPADYSSLEKIAEENHLLLLEDGAQGFGGRIGEKERAALEMQLQRLSFRQSLWDVMAMAEQSSQMMMWLQNI